ncbi:MAG TPA: hypothetical protein VKB93_10505 [Thermoanaerobaculia bacterium]|nr:hypothetical protein [Thermoanaerobaculia bacterium]
MSPNSKGTSRLQDSDPGFKIGASPDAVMDMILDHGTLSAHIVNEKGMIVVKWLVQADPSAPIRFTFGSEFVELPPTATQVYLANCGTSYGMDTDDNHFRLYRKLSTEPDKPLAYVGPQQPPLPIETLDMDDPTFGQIGLLTPDGTCSGALSREW